MANPNVQRAEVRKDPDIQGLLDRLPAKTASSLTDAQLRDLKVAIGSGKWRKHRVDIRGTLSVPFVPSKVYFVLLMGKNQRALSRQEKHIALLGLLIMIAAFLACCLSIGLVSLYLLKSSLGIDLFEQFSLGLWQWLDD